MLGDSAVLKLVAAMLFVQTKKLHQEKAGKAAAAAPPTSRSGRAKPGAASSQGSQVTLESSPKSGPRARGSDENSLSPLSH